MNVAAFAAEKKPLPTAHTPHNIEGWTLRADARVIAVWKKFRDSEKSKSVLTISGKMREHYGLTDPKEFFAEMTECYFGSNDF